MLMLKCLKIPSAALLLCLAACSAGGDPADGAAAGGASTPGAAAGAGNSTPNPTGDSLPAPTEPALAIPDEQAPNPEVEEEVVYELPDGFTETELGGYQLVGPLEESTSAVSPPDGNPCGNVMLGLVRDFSVTHPDFEDICCWNVDGMVASSLGDDMKPVFVADSLGITDNPQWTTAENYRQWYRTTESVNLPFLVKLWLEPQDDGLFTFSSKAFFPLDGYGYGDEGEWGYGHNFHFTTELHMKFAYSGGETFTFIGDDDLWVFIADHLVIDLGGVHSSMTESIDLDSLGLTRGETYSLDLFHAERHTGESNFQIQTTLELVDCGTILPEIIVN